MGNPAPKHGRLRFRLRTLLLIVAVVACGTYWLRGQRFWRTSFSLLSMLENTQPLRTFSSRMPTTNEGHFRAAGQRIGNLEKRPSNFNR